MTKTAPPLARRPAWKALAAHARNIRPRHLRAFVALYEHGAFTQCERLRHRPLMVAGD